MAKFILPEVIIAGRKEKSSVTLLNRGGLKFHGVKNANWDIVFDSDVYVDPRTEFTTEKVSKALSTPEVKAAQEEVLEVAKNLGATFIDKKKSE